jgi:hypothetical protein
MKKLAVILMNVLLVCYILTGTASVEAATKLAAPKNYKGSSKITDQYETVLTVSWSKVEGADGYEVYYRDQVPGGDEWEPWFLNETTKETTAQGFIYDGVFQMRVRAYKGSTYSDYTESITVLGGKGITSGPKANSQVKLSKTKANVNVGSTMQLKVENTTGKINWKSSNTNIATVSSKGLVKGVKQGEVSITATVGKKKLTCKITVEKSSLNASYKNILNKNISDSNSFALFDINKDGKKELLLSKCDSAASIDWDIIVYSYYNGKLYESTISGQSYPSYISSKKGIVSGGMFSSNEWMDVLVLKQGILTSIYKSGSHLKYDEVSEEWITEALLNGKAVSFEERDKADEAAGIGSAEKIGFHTLTEENIKKYVK